MQTLCKSKYQDVYRVKDGVLLLVNKFDYIYQNDGYRKRFNDVNRKNSKIYSNGCRDLTIVTDQIESNFGVAKVGQVLYHGYPVELVPKNKWDYQIKTTGDMFSGNSKEIIKYIDDIVKIIAKGD